MCVRIYKKGKFAVFGPVNIFQFGSDSVKPISCIRIKVLIIIIVIVILLIIIIIITCPIPELPE